MGIGDTIRNAINGATNATKVSDALSRPAAKEAQTGDFVRSTYGNGHTTSAMDQAMQDHADKLHPVTKAAKPVMGADWDK